MARLEARNLSFSYPEEEHPVIRDFSHTFPERGITGLLGPNGIGKSTLLALLAGAYAPGAGEVLLSGRATTAFASEDEINREVTFIFQNMEFEIEATVAEVMAMVAEENPDKHHATPQELRKAFGIDRLRFLRSSIPAVTHVDYSARVQTVDSDRSPLLHRLLTRFHEKTGCPVLINTSFNVRSEPIVCTPEDAYRCFMRTEMDVLVMGRHVLHKEEQQRKSRVEERARHLAQFQLD